MAFSWQCPFCNQYATIGENDYEKSWTDFDFDTAEGSQRLEWSFINCPNEECKKYTLIVSIRDKIGRPGDWSFGKIKKTWSLIPDSKAKTFPSYIPNPIINDYNEACLIVDLSPKASATLSRRCIQGIIRDFWKVTPGRLVEEIEQIKDKIDSTTWDAIEAVRGVGNIGAHMEKNINLIIDVEPEEAELLIGLIEILLKDWYITREEKEARLAEIKKLAGKKTQAKKNSNEAND